MLLLVKISFFALISFYRNPNPLLSNIKCTSSFFIPVLTFPIKEKGNKVQQRQGMKGSCHRTSFYMKVWS